MMDSEPMCRACLSESGDAVPIFSSAETSGVQMALSDMMMACSSVQVVSGDGLPSLICLECLRSLLIAFEFKLKCEKTDAMLREYIENNLVPAMQTTNVYNKPITVDSNTLVQVSGNSAGDIKQIVGANELISGIPITINNSNTIYSNANPYIIPMVECDVLVKEESNNIDNKVMQKSSDSNMIMKKVDSDQSNISTMASSVDMTSFSPRLISAEMIHPSQSQITIYSPEFRDLIRVSEEQATALVSGITTVNNMGQCSVLTTNSYAVESGHCGTIIQSNMVSASSTQNTNNNFLNTMAVPQNVTFTVKEGRKRASIDSDENVQHILPDPLDTSGMIQSKDTNTESSNRDQPVSKKHRTVQKKKNNQPHSSVTGSTETGSKVRLKVQKDGKNKKSSEHHEVVEIHSDDSDSEPSKSAKELYYQSSQGFR